MFSKELVRYWGSSHLAYNDRYFDCPLDCTPTLERSQSKRNLIWDTWRSLLPLKEIRRKKKDVQIFSTPRATQIPVDFENPEHDVNHELSEFQDSSNHVVHEKDSLRAFRNSKGHVIEPSSHMRRKKRLVQESHKTSNWRSHLQPPQSLVFIASHETPGLVMKAFNIDWPSLVKTKLSTQKWPLSFQDVKDFWTKVILIQDLIPHRITYFFQIHQSRSF